MLSVAFVSMFVGRDLEWSLQVFLALKPPRVFIYYKITSFINFCWIMFFGGMPGGMPGMQGQTDEPEKKE